MRLRSLSTRLLVTSLAWSAFALVATALVLISTFRVSVEARFDDTLGVHLSNLIGELADMPDGIMPQSIVDLGEPRFVLPLSGWYWQVNDPDSGEVLRGSDSLAGDQLMVPYAINDVPALSVVRGDGQGPAGDPLRLVSRRVRLESLGWIVLTVAADRSAIEQDTARFAARLALVLGLFAATLVAVTFIQWRVGLRPLKKLGAELEDIHAGRVRHVVGRYPLEIEPVAEALNALIDSNHATLERSRQHVGNLAHALKTPISVMQNDATGSSTLAQSVREQTQIMQSQVRHYLERAQMAAKERLIGTVTETGPVMERLVRAMARLGERRGIAVRYRQDGPVRFAGERQDFEEIVGNLVDNGLKWASNEVRIGVEPLPDARYLRVTISDDGPGLTADERTDVLSRGRRLDASKPGSGLGLSIVSELVALYGGRLALERAPQGGLAVVVDLPRV